MKGNAKIRYTGSLEYLHKNGYNFDESSDEESIQTNTKEMTKAQNGENNK
jgi:hypothetical protein